MPTASAVRRIQIATLVALFLVLVSNVWRIGVMHTDDAAWVLGAQRSAFRLAWEWATSQGRLFATVAGTLMLHAMRYDGTLYGELLKYGSFAAFLLAWSAVLWTYWGRSLALLSTALFLGWHALRFEGSALVTYPLLVWPTATAAASAILAGHRYVKSGGAGWLAATAAALFFSLFTNEALTVTFAALAMLAWAANRWLVLDASPRSGKWRLTRRDTLLAAAILAAIALYAVLALSFALLYPSHYPGHAIAPFAPLRIASVLAEFSASGSVLHDLLFSYRVNYADKIAGSGSQIIYYASDAFRGTAGALPEMLLGLAAACLIWTLVEPESRSARSAELAPRLPLCTALLPGLCFAIGPVAPVALTERYQNWHVELGVPAYVTTIVCHFGYSIAVAALILLAADRIRGTRRAIWFVGCVSLVAGLLTFIAVRTNERIAYDMRPEGARWAVFRRALPLMREVGFDTRRIWAPQFASGSWFSVVPESHWSNYAAARFGLPLEVKYGNLAPDDLAAGVDVLTYAMSGDRRTFDIIAAELRRLGDAGASITRIAIELGEGTQSARANAVLSYVDRRKGPQQVHVNTLTPAGGRRYTLDSIDAVPGTLRLAHQTMPPAL